jgi:hypothetical protein
MAKDAGGGGDVFDATHYEGFLGCLVAIPHQFYPRDSNLYSV